MSCTEKDCAGKGERRCSRCQELLCYSCWKFITEEHGGVCTVCRTPAPEPPMEEWRRRMYAPLAKNSADWNKRRKRRTHCPYNHPIKGKNRVWAGVAWDCRICKDRRAKESAQRRRAAWIAGGCVGNRPR